MSGLVKNRYRNQTISFRMSPDERRQLESRIIISGMPKGKFIIQSLLHKEIYITVGKYQSDRLSLELRRLWEQIGSVNSGDNENLALLLKDCKELLEQLQDITIGKDDTKLELSDCMSEIQK